MLKTLLKNFSNLKTQKETIKLAITGAKGNISYSLLFWIANGDIFGKQQQVELSLIDLPENQNALEGVKMELQDCNFPQLKQVQINSSLAKGVQDADYAIFLGAKPRKQGMEWSDLLIQNGKIFKEAGKILSDNAKRNLKSLVVGNPANTNCLILQQNAQGVHSSNFSCLTWLDFNRGMFLLQEYLEQKQRQSKQNKQKTIKMDKFVIWGNHSQTMFPDIHFLESNKQNIKEQIDQKWYREFLIEKVQKRGNEIISKRGLSSSASAAQAIVDHLKDWHFGTKDNWTSAGVFSNGEYDIQKGLIFSFPLKSVKGNYQTVKDLKLNDFQKEMLRVTEKELIKEKEMVSNLL